MAFADAGSGAVRVDAGSPQIAVTAGEAWSAGDLIGYSGGWVKADANVPIRPLAVALTGAASGELSRPIAFVAVVYGGRYSGGTPGASLYASDTAGSVSESQGTITYPVGRVLAADVAVLYPLFGASDADLYHGPW